MIKSMVDPVGSTSASKESDIVAFGEAQRATLSALQPFFLVPKFDEEREKVLATDVRSVLLTDLPLVGREVPTFHCRQPDSDLVARLRFLFVRPCAARSPAQVTWTRGRGHPTVPGARWRSPLALTSDHPPPIHPFVFEAVAPRKLVSQLREITDTVPRARGPAGAAAEARAPRAAPGVVVAAGPRCSVCRRRKYKIVRR